MQKIEWYQNEISICKKDLHAIQTKEWNDTAKPKIPTTMLNVDLKDCLNHSSFFQLKG